MFLIVNLLGIFVFIAIAALLSNDRKNIQWRSVGIVLILEIALAGFSHNLKLVKLRFKVQLMALIG